MRISTDDHVILLRPLAELRAIAEELTGASSTPWRGHAIGALILWLHIHCAVCGDLIDRNDRYQGDTRCVCCAQPPPPPQASDADADDVPF